MDTITFHLRVFLRTTKWSWNSSYSAFPGQKFSIEAQVIISFSGKYNFNFLWANWTSKMYIWKRKHAISICLHVMTIRKAYQNPRRHFLLGSNMNMSISSSLFFLSGRFKVWPNRPVIFMMPPCPLANMHEDFWGVGGGGG